MLNNAVILITGAGKGIGEAVVFSLLERKAEFPGLRLFLTSRTASDLERLKAQAKSLGVSCEYSTQDLAEAPLAALQECIRVYGRLDALIHSAGVGRFGEFLDLTKEDLQYVLKTNVEASFLLMQAAYRQMAMQGTGAKFRGQIQWVTSVAAEKPFPLSSIYCMSKFAQKGLIEVMRQYAYRDRIRILEVQPGATFTPMWGEVNPEMKEKMMSAQDVANPMVDALLMSPQASLEVLTLRPIQGDL